MNAIILAAGEGKRLHPLTLTKPKCMVELFGKPILERQLSIFKKCGIDDICIVTGFKSELINYPNVDYIKNPNFMKTNMLESLFCASKKFTESTIVSYGDILFEQQVLKKLIDSKGDFSIIIDKQWEKYWKIRSNNPLNDLESLKLDGEQNITSIGKKVENLNEEIQKEYKKDPNDLERVFLREFGNFGITIYKASDENISNWNKLEMNGDIINPQVNEIPCN